MANFDISGKVALVTGGSSGIGLTYAQQLLKNGAKGVTVVDINETAGQKVVKELEQQYGPNKVIFVQVDVTDYQQFEAAFRTTVATFKNVDILINNGGILDETDAQWRKMVEVNIIGVLNGILLALEHYLPKHKSGQEGLIVNTSSITGIYTYPFCPIYSATKSAINGATLSFGHPVHYEKTHVRIVAICPGATESSLVTQYRYGEYKGPYLSRSFQRLDEIAPELVKVIQKAPNGTIWVLEDGEPAYQFVMPKRQEEPKVYL